MIFYFNRSSLKELMGPYAYRDLTDGGKDDIADQALHEAKGLLESKYVCFGSDPVWTNQRVIQAALYYAIYFLYHRAENEVIALDKRQTGNQILSSIIGICAFDIDQGDGIKPTDFINIKSQYVCPPIIKVLVPDSPYTDEGKIF